MILGSAKAAMIRIMVTTMISSISEKPRSRLRLRMDVTFLVSSGRSLPQNTASDLAWEKQLRPAEPTSEIIRQPQTDVKGRTSCWTDTTEKSRKAIGLLHSENAGCRS